MISVNELLVISVELTRKMSKFSQLNRLIFQEIVLYFPISPLPYLPIIQNL